MTTETTAAWTEVAHALESFGRGTGTPLDQRAESATSATALHSLAEAGFRAAQRAAALTGRAPGEAERTGAAVAYALCAAALAIPATGRHAVRPAAPAADELDWPAGDLPATLFAGPEGQLIVMTVPAAEDPEEETYPLDQLLLVLSGTGECVTAGRTLPLAESGALCLPSGVSHVVRATGAGPLRLACVLTAPRHRSAMIPAARRP
jgi:mannose-6-phosphate isomerase-like protein (cupin superfamily)